MALTEEVVGKMSDLITAAFGLVAALAWNEAIQAIFRALFGEAANIPAQVGYAVTVTLIAVIATILIGRALARARERERPARR
jgi:cellobiose-specific phosphotransferase system component IIC